MSTSTASILASIRASRNRWWSSKCPAGPGEGFLEFAILDRIRVRASWASTLGSRSPAIRAAIIARPETPKCPRPRPTA